MTDHFFLPLMKEVRRSCCCCFAVFEFFLNFFITVLTNTSINLMEQLLGEPEMPESDDAANIFAHNVYLHALRAIDGDTKKFDTLQPYLVCGEKGHSFDGCPMLNDIDYLMSLKWT